MGYRAELNIFWYSQSAAPTIPASGIGSADLLTVNKFCSAVHQFFIFNLQDGYGSTGILSTQP
jgi:hypothetical protein